MNNIVKMSDRPRPGNENYSYWQDNGSWWGGEYERRKRFNPYLHLQEVFIAEMISRTGASRVLEYGCGVGRHLRYIWEMPGVEGYGFDQSATMVANMADWAREELLGQRVTVGAPIGRLPYRDNEFDIVFTSEVLVHVCPEDVPGILAELARISKRLVFHLEPDPKVEVASNAHNGCWSHDLLDYYQQLGMEARALPRLFECQLPVVVERNADSGARGNIPFGEMSSTILYNMERTICSVLEPAVLDGALEIDWTAKGNISFESVLDGKTDLAVLPRRELIALTLRALRQEKQATEFRNYATLYGIPGRESSPFPRLGARPKICIQVIDKNPASKGSEVWLRFARRKVDDPAIPWSILKLENEWKLVAADGCTEDMAVYGTSGTIELPDGDAPVLNFMRHPFSGRVRITWRGRERLIDLYRADASDDLTVNLQVEAT